MAEFTVKTEYDGYYTIVEASVRTRIHTRALYEAARAGRIDAHRFGYMWLVPDAVVDKLAESGVGAL